jgi:hypothetical protein
MYVHQQPLESDMPLTRSQLFAHAHAITRMKNVAYLGGYQKAFALVLRQCYTEKLVYGWNV